MAVLTMLPATSRIRRMVLAIIPALALWWFLDRYAVSMIRWAEGIGGVREWMLIGFFGNLFIIITSFVTAIALREFLRLFNPRVQLMTDPAGIRPGTTVEVGWRVSGGLTRLKRLVVALVAVENPTGPRAYGAVYHVRLPVAEKWEAPEIRLGQVNFSVPDSTPDRSDWHWFLWVHGDVPWWPDIDEEFVISRPSTAAAAAASMKSEEGPEPIVMQES